VYGHREMLVIFSACFYVNFALLCFFFVLEVFYGITEATVVSPCFLETSSFKILTYLIDMAVFPHWTLFKLGNCISTVK
jgi:hypothetical protein